MNDRDAIVELVSQMGLLIDARDWKSLRELFCESVRLDFGSQTGGPPQELSRDELVAIWQTDLARLAATQHLIAGHVVDLNGDEAVVTANGIATHVAGDAVGDRLWTSAGRYDFVVRRTDASWRIAAVTFTLRWATGNQALLRA